MFTYNYDIAGRRVWKSAIRRGCTRLYAKFRTREMNKWLTMITDVLTRDVGVRSVATANTAATTVVTLTIRT